MSESGGVSKQFDPRFSPAFQPGYDPRVHREEPPRDLTREDVIAAGGAPLGSAPHGSAPLGSAPIEHPVFAIPGSEGSDVAGTVPTSGLSDPVTEPQVRAWWQRINPWLILLWVLGIAFIGAGVGLIYLSMPSVSGGGDYYGNSSNLMFFMLQSAYFGSPLLIVLGLATITSSVVILANRWRR